METTKETEQTTRSRDQLGKAAYEAFAGSESYRQAVLRVLGSSYQIPPWEDFGELERESWRVAADAVESLVLTRVGVVSINEARTMMNLPPYEPLLKEQSSSARRQLRGGPMTWSAMTPRQRNALVAKKLMGYTVRDAGRYSGGFADVVEPDPAQRCYQLFDGQGNLASRELYLTIESAWLDAPRFTETMDAAWQVVERITRLPKALKEAERAANARFGFWFDSANLWASSAQEAAEAICLAALGAAGVAIEV